LLHPEVGAADGRRVGVVLQAHEHEEGLEKVLVGTDSQVSLAQHLERCHLLDVVRVEVLQLEPCS
jgi:hypothetical protein